MTDTRDLDREWAELAGWEPLAGRQVTTDPSKADAVFWGAPDGTICDSIPPYSSDPAACFGPGGPWEWMKSEGLSPALYVEDDGSGCRAVSCSHDGKFIEAYGATEYEAITECAIKARKQLEGPKA